jgi:hypothetical protein
MTAVEKFMPLVLEAEEEEQTPSPVISTDDGVNFLYIRHNNLYRMYQRVNFCVWTVGSTHRLTGLTLATNLYYTQFWP